MSNQFDPPPQKSGGSNVLMTVLIVCGVLFLGCAGFCGVSAYFGVRAAKEAAKDFTHGILKESVAIQANIAVTANEDVKEKLGDVEIGPTEFDGDPPKALEVTSLKLKFNVTGEKGKGVAHFRGEQKAGNWRVTEIKVQLEDGTTITVPPPPEDAPPALNFDLGPDDEKK